MLEFISWYGVIVLIGLSVFPIAFRFLSFLPDKGLALVKPLGMILWGYLFWMLGTLHILPNSLGGQTAAWMILVGASLWLGRGQWREMLGWLRSHWKTLIFIEALFIILFAGWALVRAANPNVTGAEKPMEMAFISSILRSSSFPPNDPWLSGYAISYYYFGYVMVAMLSRAAGTGIGITFNLASALWFALTGTAVYGIVYNLVNRKWQSEARGGIRFRPLLGTMFLLFISNLEGFLEFIHARGIFWQKTPDGILQSKFWTWLKIAELNQPPAEPFSWLPNRPGGVLWWRASRVIQDFKLPDNPAAVINPVAPVEIIDEFPFFSYLLADLHPHVLGLPFCLLAIGWVLNIYFGGYQNIQGKITDWVRTREFWFGALVMGGLGFLNLWDFPIYVGLFSLVYALIQTHRSGWSAQRIWEFLTCGVSFGLAGLLLYLPFYISFDSQAGGILPSFLFFIRGINFWVMFASLLLPIIAWLILQARAARGGLAWKSGLTFGLGLLGSLWVFMLILSLAAINLVSLGTSISASNSDLGLRIASWGRAFLDLQGGTAILETGGLTAGLLAQAFLRRLASPGAWLTITGLLIVCWALCAHQLHAGDDQPVERNFEILEPGRFVLLMILLGALLTLVPEFVYLRDQFGTRMNTIFKFYYQAWLLWSIAAAYGSIMAFDQLKSGWRWGYSVAWVVLMLMALAYPVYMLPVRMEEGGRDVSEWTLDGTEYIAAYNPDEAEAIAWLSAAPDGVLVEAVGGAYTGYGRISVHTGLPAVMGWATHESQWRGGYEEIGSRPDDVKAIYASPSWEETMILLSRYQVRYIYLGGLERGTYDVSLLKFEKYLIPVFSNATVTIYEVPEQVRSVLRYE